MLIVKLAGSCSSLAWSWPLVLVSGLSSVSLLQVNVRCSPRRVELLADSWVGPLESRGWVCHRSCPWNAELLSLPPRELPTTRVSGTRQKWFSLGGDTHILVGGTSSPSSGWTGWTHCGVQVYFSVMKPQSSAYALPTPRRKPAWRHSHMADTSAPPNQEEGDQKKLGLLGILIYLSTVSNNQEGQNSQYHLGSKWPKWPTSPYHLLKQGLVRPGFDQKAKFSAQPCTRLPMKTDHRTTGWPSNSAGVGRGTVCVLNVGKSSPLLQASQSRFQLAFCPKFF